MNGNRDRALRWVLRVVGTAAFLALPCALMPLEWMNATHQWLLGESLPTGPIVPYLARSTSLFYALLGGLMWITSFDVRRYQVVITYLGGGLLTIGLILLGVDLLAGLPPWWVLYEGPWDAAIGVVILLLNRPEKNASRF